MPNIAQLAMAFRDLASSKKEDKTAISGNVNSEALETQATLPFQDVE